MMLNVVQDRKSTRLNSSHTVIYTLSLHDALPISPHHGAVISHPGPQSASGIGHLSTRLVRADDAERGARSEEHTSELQSHRDLHSFPTRRSSDLSPPRRRNLASWPAICFRHRSSIYPSCSR